MGLHLAQKGKIRFQDKKKPKVKHSLSASAD